LENRKFSPEQKIEALERAEYMCGGCGQNLWRQHLPVCEAHHIVPFSLGGATTQENLIVLCPNCHVYHDNLAICGVFYGGYEHSDIDKSQLRNRQLFENTKQQCEKNRETEGILKHIYSYEEEKLKKPKKPNKKESLLYSKEYNKRRKDTIKTNDNP